MRMRNLLAAAAAILLLAGPLRAQTLHQFDTTPWAGFAPGRVQCGSALGVNANAGTTDTAVQIAVPSVLNGGGSYFIDKIIYTNASVSLSTATAGWFTAAGGTGVTIVTDAALSGLTAAALNAAGSAISPTLAATTEAYNLTQIYLRVGTAQGAPATFDARVYCIPLYGSPSAPY